MPGPGSYNTLRTPGKDCPKYSMRVWTANPAHYSTAKTVPGPGAYQILSAISPKGNYAYSKYRGSAAALFGPSKSSRFKTIRNALF